MKKLLAGLVALLWSGLAQAQTASFYQLTDSASTLFKVRVFTCQTIYICPVSVSSDSSGNPLSGTVGTTNPNGTAMYVQGVTGGVPVSVSSTPATNVTLNDCSGTIISGGSANNAFTAQTTLHGFTIASTSTTEVMWISFTGTATAGAAGSYPLAAATPSTFAGLNSFTSPPGMGTNHALSVLGATTGHPYSCTWW